jgi:hypothetical protein
MTMTGRVMADQIGSEFLPDVSAVPWAHEFGAIDAGGLIPSGSTKQFVKGRRGFGIPRTEGREKRA